MEESSALIVCVDSVDRFVFLDGRVQIALNNRLVRRSEFDLAARLLDIDQKLLRSCISWQRHVYGQLCMGLLPDVPVCLSAVAGIWS